MLSIRSKWQQRVTSKGKASEYRGLSGNCYAFVNNHWITLQIKVNLQFQSGSLLDLLSKWFRFVWEGCTKQVGFTTILFISVSTNEIRFFRRASGEPRGAKTEGQTFHRCFSKSYIMWVKWVDFTIEITLGSWNCESDLSGNQKTRKWYRRKSRKATSDRESSVITTHLISWS